MKGIRWGWVIKESIHRAIHDNITKMAAALAYYTLFSLPAILLLVTAGLSLFMTKSVVEENIFREIGLLIGAETANQIRGTLTQTYLLGDTHFATIAGIGSLFIGATGVFSEIQDSINQIWGVRTKPHLSYRAFIISRLLSFGMIATLGFLLLVSLLFSAILSVLTERLSLIFPDLAVYVVWAIETLFSFSLIVILFAGIFKVLPDVHIRFQDVFTGSIFTAILFLLGKYAISFYLGTSRLATAYGAAGSIIILLIWVYYSSILLYFGAQFTHVFAVKYGKGIRPNKYSEWRDVSTDAGVVQKSE